MFGFFGGDRNARIFQQQGDSILQLLVKLSFNPTSGANHHNFAFITICGGSIPFLVREFYFIQKNCDFTWFGRKIKINRDLVGILRNFIDNSIKIHIVGLQSFVAFRISIGLFRFFDETRKITIDALTQR